MQRIKHPVQELASELALFCLMAASIVLLYRNNALLFAVLLVEAAIALRLWNGPSDHSSFWVIAVLGTVAGIVLICFGVWRYANPSVVSRVLWHGRTHWSASCHDD